MRILVTGGCGFIGSNFINYILEKYPQAQIYNVDKVDYCARLKNVNDNPRHHFIHADITNRDQMKIIFSSVHPETVIHFAAQSFVDLSFENSFQFTTDNVLGTHVLLECAKNYGSLHKFIHVSTDEVYGEVADHVVCDESAPLNPMNPYAASKAAAELYVKAYTTCYNLPCIITRGNNVFGPRQYPEKVVPIFIQQLLSKKPVTIHGDGTAKRNFIFVDDVCKAVETILFKGVIGETYNIGTKYEFSVYDMYKMLSDLISYGNGPVQFVSDPRPHNDSRYCIDSSKLRALGWSEDSNFIEQLEETVDWYFKNTDYF
jgi:dTDP-glucose 4,6-dehydratase